MALRPQVVFVTNYAPQEMIDKISRLGIPVVAISLRHDIAGEQAKMNPTPPMKSRLIIAGCVKE